MSKDKECYRIIEGDGDPIIESPKFLELINRIVELLLKDSYVIHIALNRRDGHYIFKSILGEVYTESKQLYKLFEVEDLLKECDEFRILHSSKTVIGWKN